MPSSMARRSTARAAAASAGGPKTPGPASCIAPNPTRLTVCGPRRAVCGIVGEPVTSESAGFGPADIQPALGEAPRPVGLDEAVLIAKRCDHQPAQAAVRRDVVGQAVGLARRAVAVDPNGAQAVEVHRDVVGVQVVEYGPQRLPATQIVRRVAALAGHIDDEVGVVSEQGHLPLGVASIGAERVGVDQLADGPPVRGLCGGDGGVVGHHSLIRFTPASGPPTCCIAPPVARPPRSIATKPASSNSAVTWDFASASSPERKITRRPPPSCGSEPSTAAPRVFAAFTTRAPGTRSATTSLEVRPLRSLALKSFVVSMTVMPSHRRPSTASPTRGHGTAMTTMSAPAARSTVPADARSPSGETTDASDSGPRLLARTAWRPARSAVRAIAWPSRPAPMIPTLLMSAASWMHLRAIAQVEPDRLHDPECGAGGE